ncbi:hypothetical protein EZL74_11080 [Flavobacterium silvisoli]|uniref:DUF695 domain-containing protein n=1 Tax=Flavobacterium silvisoli TaxID=2529433 RepID=A0A4Q9YXM0_9FLAO|nr:hypothetical protein [Flavobacterium silvisoli]TBX66124.1 hypothetical protein EZL74_11080 [Flavobacterium silvisoli]
MKNNANHFWDWFINHKNKFKNLKDLNPKEQTYYLFWLDWHLQFYFRGMEYTLIFPKFKNQKVQLIITASGNKELLQKAIDLEKTAPKLRDWKFTAVIKPQQYIDDIKIAVEKP